MTKRQHHNLVIFVKSFFRNGNNFPNKGNTLIIEADNIMKQALKRHARINKIEITKEEIEEIVKTATWV